MGSATRSRTVLLVVGSLVGLLVAIAVVLALQPPPVFDPSTPEGAAQGYYQGALDGDYGPQTRAALVACLEAGCRVVE